MDIGTNLTIEGGNGHVFVARFPDQGDARNAEIAFECAALNLGRRVTDWLKDKPRGRETAARWALFFDAARGNTSVRVGICR